MTAESARPSFVSFRILAGVLSLPLTACGFLFSRTGFDLLFGGVILSFFAAAILCFWFAFRGHISADRVLILFALTGGMIIGSICFIAGFIGPIIFMPHSNQGPLLGIFVTGPFGFVAGTLIGLC